MEQIVSIDKAKAVIDSGIDQASALIKNNEQLNDLMTKVQTKIEETPVLNTASADFRTTLQMVKSYAKKEYTGISPKTAAILVSALLYLIKRKDLISDSIPLIGALDDLAVIAAALKLSEPDLKAYLEWKKAKEAEA